MCRRVATGLGVIGQFHQMWVPIILTKPKNDNRQKMMKSIRGTKQRQTLGDQISESRDGGNVRRVYRSPALRDHVFVVVIIASYPSSVGGASL